MLLDPLIVLLLTLGAGIFKRLIEILKGSHMSQVVLTSSLKAFRCLLERSATADTFRSIALYITYALQVEQHPRLKSMIATQDGRHRGRMITVVDQIRGAAVLRMLSDYLCQANRSDSTRRFARSVTTQVSTCATMRTVMKLNLSH